MANVCAGTEQGDARLLCVDDLHHVLIDTRVAGHGRPTTAAAALQADIEAWIWSSSVTPIRTTTAGWNVLLEHDIEIRRLYFNLLDRDQCLKEITWGCDYDDVVGLRDRLPAGE